MQFKLITRYKLRAKSSNTAKQIRAKQHRVEIWNLVLSSLQTVGEQFENFMDALLITTQFLFFFFDYEMATPIITTKLEDLAQCLY